MDAIRRGSWRSYLVSRRLSVTRRFLVFRLQPRGASCCIEAGPGLAALPPPSRLYAPERAAARPHLSAQLWSLASGDPQPSWPVGPLVTARSAFLRECRSLPPGIGVDEPRGRHLRSRCGCISYNSLRGTGKSGVAPWSSRQVALLFPGARSRCPRFASRLLAQMPAVTLGSADRRCADSAPVLSSISHRVASLRVTARRIVYLVPRMERSVRECPPGPLAPPRRIGAPPPASPVRSLSASASPAAPSPSSSPVNEATHRNFNNPPLPRHFWGIHRARSE